MNRIHIKRKISVNHQNKPMRVFLHLMLGLFMGLSACTPETPPSTIEEASAKEVSVDDAQSGPFSRRIDP